MAVKVAFSVLAVSLMVLFCLCAEVARESSVASSVEEKAQSGNNSDLVAVNPDYAGWLTVEGTSISTPVVSCRAGDPDGFYLSHGFDRAPSFSGCPFMAEGSTPSSSNMMVYGHNMGFGTLAFTELQNCYRQERLDEFGIVTFMAKDGKKVAYKPVLGMRVPKNYDTLLRFDFAGDSDFSAWCESLSERATASSAAMDKKSPVLTLVTCSSAIGGERFRSVLVCEMAG